MGRSNSKKIIIKIIIGKDGKNTIHTRKEERKIEREKEESRGGEGAGEASEQSLKERLFG
jgi:hypothetical protein